MKNRAKAVKRAGVIDNHLKPTIAFKSDNATLCIIKGDFIGKTMNDFEIQEIKLDNQISVF